VNARLYRPNGGVDRSRCLVVPKIKVIDQDDSLALVKREGSEGLLEEVSEFGSLRGSVGPI